MTTEDPSYLANCPDGNMDTGQLADVQIELVFSKKAMVSEVERAEAIRVIEQALLNVPGLCDGLLLKLGDRKGPERKIKAIFVPGKLVNFCV